MIKTLSHGLSISLLLLSLSATAQDETAAEEVDIYAGCTRLSHGWEDGDVARTKNTRLNNTVFTEHEGKTIRNIHFNTIDVFDETNPDENNRVYRFLNRFHINTKPHVIKSQLLFKEGDQVDRKVIQESTRILRTRKYLTTAYIWLDAVCGEEVDVLVVTQDSWSLEPQVSLSRHADDTESGFALSDDNVLGTGNSIVVGYEQEADRNAIRYSFSNPHFLDKAIAVRLSYAQTSDGDNSLIDISRPFYSLNTPWATGIRLYDNSEISVIRSGGDVVNKYHYQRVNEEVFYGRAIGITEEFTHRLYAGISKEEDIFLATEDTVTGLPEDRRIVYPWLGYQFLNNQFGVYKNVNQIQRPEDIALGINADVRIGYGGTSLDSADEVVRFKGSISNIVDVVDSHIMEMSVEIDGRQHNAHGLQDSTIFGAEVAYHYFLNDKNRYYLRMRYDIGRDLPQHDQLTAGDTTGLRGFPTDYQRGEKRYVINFERRYFSDYHLFNLLRMGGVAFFDVGKAWGAENSGVTPLLANVGIGLRLSSSKVRVGNVVHIDLAFPIVDVEGVSEYQLLFGAQSRF